jgi:hypothetical protein
METETPLDRAHRAMEVAPEDTAVRLAYYAALARSELVLWLEAEPGPGATGLSPRLLPLDEGPVALAFDGEVRLAAVAGSPVPYAALPGRVVLARLAGQGVGLGVNLGAGGAFLMDAAAVDWAADVLLRAARVAPASAVPLALRAPDALPAGLTAALAASLGPVAAGAEVWLALAEDAGGTRRPLVAVTGLPAAEVPALAQALAEAMAFAGGAEAAADLAVLAPDDPQLARLRRLGLRLDAETPPPPPPAAERPPRLR